MGFLNKERIEIADLPIKSIKKCQTILKPEFLLHYEISQKGN